MINRNLGRFTAAYGDGVCSVKVSELFFDGDEYDLKGDMRQYKIDVSAESYDEKNGLDIDSKLSFTLNSLSDLKNLANVLNEAVASINK